jgi:hypothetical protein
MNSVILHAFTADGTKIKPWRGQRLQAVTPQIRRLEAVDLEVRFFWQGHVLDCRLVAFTQAHDHTMCYLLTNLNRDNFRIDHIADAYRLRWQIELLFKEWKSHANLKAFDTNNPDIAQGLIWAALRAATLKRYCAHMTERLYQVAMSTQRVAMCARHVLTGILRALLHAPTRLLASITPALNYLAQNAQRAHPKRDVRKCRLKIGMVHSFWGA